MLSLTVIRKNSGFSKFYPKYILKTEHTGEFILNAKKRIGNKKSNYIITMKEGEFDKKKDSFIGKLRLLVANKYVIYDNGENFERNMYASRFKLRNEYGGIMFKGGAKKTQTSEDNKEDMLVGIPYVDNLGNVHEFKPLKNEQSMIHTFDFNQGDDNVIRFMKKGADASFSNNEVPLNFGKRIIQSSIKNTQLTKIINSKSNDCKDDVIFQFGRIDSSTFALDLKYPFSIAQGFGIALAIFDH